MCDDRDLTLWLYRGRAAAFLTLQSIATLLTSFETSGFLCGDLVRVSDPVLSRRQQAEDCRSPVSRLNGRSVDGVAVLRIKHEAIIIAPCWMMIIDHWMMFIVTIKIGTNFNPLFDLLLISLIFFSISVSKQHRHSMAMLLKVGVQNWNKIATTEVLPVVLRLSTLSHSKIGDFAIIDDQNDVGVVRAGGAAYVPSSLSVKKASIYYASPIYFRPDHTPSPPKNVSTMP